MIGKALAGIFLVGLIATAITFLTTGMIPIGSGGKSLNATIITFSTIGGGAFVFLLNLFGLGFRPKYFGAWGTLLAAVILGYGIYVLVTNNAILPVQHSSIPIVGGISTGVGAVGLLTSTGILTR